MSIQEEISLIEYCIELLEQKPKCKIAAQELRRTLVTFKLAMKA